MQIANAISDADRMDGRMYSGNIRCLFHHSSIGGDIKMVWIAFARATYVYFLQIVFK